MHIGKRIKQYVKSNPDIDEKSLAESIGVAYEYVWRIYNKESISTELLEKILSVLGISYLEFFNEEKEPPQANEGNIVYGIKKARDINQTISRGETDCLKKLNEAQQTIISLQNKVIELMGSK